MNQMTEQSNHDLCLLAIEQKKNLELEYLSLGATLHAIKERQAFESGWSSWEEYCMELKMSESSISKLLRIYEIFVLRYAIEQPKLAAAGGWSTLAELLPLVSPQETSRERVEELLEIVTTQTRSDARKTIKGAVDGSPEDCNHADTYIIRICCDCPERWEIKPSWMENEEGTSRT
jgi:hypothetical protein